MGRRERGRRGGGEGEERGRRGGGEGEERGRRGGGEGEERGRRGGGEGEERKEGEGKGPWEGMIESFSRCRVSCYKLPYLLVPLLVESVYL